MIDEALNIVFVDCIIIFINYARQIYVTFCNTHTCSIENKTKRNWKVDDNFKTKYQVHCYIAVHSGIYSVPLSRNIVIYDSYSCIYCDG